MAAPEQASERNWYGISPITGAPYGLPEPDWDLMDPVTGVDRADFAQLRAQVAADEAARDEQELAEDSGCLGDG